MGDQDRGLIVGNSFDGKLLVFALNLAKLASNPPEPVKMWEEAPAPTGPSPVVPMSTNGGTLQIQRLPAVQLSGWGLPQVFASDATSLASVYRAWQNPRAGWQIGGIDDWLPDHPWDDWNAWQDFGVPPGGMKNNIAMERSRYGLLWAFATANDNQVYFCHERRPGDIWLSAPQWFELGQQQLALDASPVVTRHADGRMVVFARSSDDQLVRISERSRNMKCTSSPSIHAT